MQATCVLSPQTLSPPRACSRAHARPAELDQGLVGGRFLVFADVVVIGLDQLAVDGVAQDRIGDGGELIERHALQPACPHADPGQQAAWSRATIAFALGQAVGAYGLSYLFARTGGYDPLFACATTALVLALLVDLAAGRARR